VLTRAIFLPHCDKTAVNVKGLGSFEGINSTAAAGAAEGAVATANHGRAAAAAIAKVVKRRRMGKRMLAILTCAHEVISGLRALPQGGFVSAEELRRKAPPDQELRI
jgi:hypothetical protein